MGSRLILGLPGGGGTFAAKDPDETNATPDQFAFTDVTGAAVSTQYHDIQFIVGVTAGETVSVTNGDLSNDGVNWFASVDMSTGNTRVRSTVTSSASRNTAVDTVTTVNGVTDTFTVTTFVNSAPVFAGTVAAQSDAHGNAITPLDLSTYFTDADTDPLTYSVTTGSLPAGLALDANTGIISGTPTTTGTTVALVITADDGFSGTDVTNSFSWEITNAAPVFAGTVAAQSDDRNLAITPLDLSTFFTDANNDALTYTVTTGTLPAGLSIAANTGLVSGTPSTIGTTAALVITATDPDAASDVTNSFSWEITNIQPVINNQSMTAYDGAVATTVIGTVSASDGNDDTLAYSITAGNTNSDLAIGAATGVITVAAGHTLDQGVTASYSLTIQVDDQTGAGNATNTATVVITVQAASGTTYGKCIRNIHGSIISPIIDSHLRGRGRH